MIRVYDKKERRKGLGDPSQSVIKVTQRYHETLL